MAWPFFKVAPLPPLGVDRRGDDFFLCFPFPDSLLPGPSSLLFSGCVISSLLSRRCPPPPPLPTPVRFGGAFFLFCILSFFFFFFFWSWSGSFFSPGIYPSFRRQIISSSFFLRKKGGRRLSLFKWTFFFSPPPFPSR